MTKWIEKHKAQHEESERRMASRFDAMDDLRLGWVAGIFDGEGSVSLNRNGRGQSMAIRLTVASADPWMAPRLHDLLGGVIVRARSRNEKWSDQLRWNLRLMGEVAVFCERLADLLIVKHRQARLMAEFCRIRMTTETKSYGPRELEIFRDLGAINDRKTRKKRMPA